MDLHTISEESTSSFRGPPVGGLEFSSAATFTGLGLQYTIHNGMITYLVASQSDQWRKTVSSIIYLLANLWERPLTQASSILCSSMHSK